MRVLLTLLMIAIGLSGYSAAAHAFGKGSCALPAIEKTADHGMDMQDCPDDQAAQGQNDDTGHDSSAKAKCVDCAHCCAAHAAHMPDVSLSIVAQAAMPEPPRASGLAVSFTSSLLRPPKSPV